MSHICPAFNKLSGCEEKTFTKVFQFVKVSACENGIHVCHELHCKCNAFHPIKNCEFQETCNRMLTCTFGHYAGLRTCPQEEVKLTLASPPTPPLTPKLWPKKSEAKQDIEAKQVEGKQVEAKQDIDAKQDIEDVQEDELTKAFGDAKIARDNVVRETRILDKNMKELKKLNEAIANSKDKVLRAKLAYKEKKDLLDGLEASMDMDPIETQDEQEEKQD